MSSRPPRKRTRVAVTILIAALIAGTFFVWFYFGAIPTAVQSGGLHKVTFLQSGGCSPPFASYVEPWSVTLANHTQAAPPNAKLPVQSIGSYQNLPIAFYKPNGVYPYNVDAAVYFSPSSGTVNVNGSDVTVTVQVVTSCPSITSIQTSNTHN